MARLNRDFSPLFDPLILNSEDAVNKVGGAFQMPKIDWIWWSVNLILPLIFFLVIAFSLKYKYDLKRQRLDEYFVLD